MIALGGRKGGRESRRKDEAREKERAGFRDVDLRARGDCNTEEDNREKGALSTAVRQAGAQRSDSPARGAPHRCAEKHEQSRSDPSRKQPARECTRAATRRRGDQPTSAECMRVQCRLSLAIVSSASSPLSPSLRQCSVGRLIDLYVCAQPADDPARFLPLARLPTRRQPNEGASGSPGGNGNRAAKEKGGKASNHARTDWCLPFARSLGVQIPSSSLRSPVASTGSLSSLSSLLLRPPTRTMSSLNPNGATSASESSSRKRPRHFHQGPHGGDNEQRQADEAAPAQPPATRLYRHALESIFGFLSLADLSQVLAVSRAWSAAAGSMRGIDASLESLPAAHPLFELCASRVARHIGTLGSEKKIAPLTQERLFLVGVCMTGLHTLHCKLPSPLVGPLLFPPSLTHLNVDSSVSFEQVNLVIEAASRIPKLLVLKLCKLSSRQHLVFAPLRRSTHLHTLSLDFPSGPHLSLQQADQLRAIPNLTNLDAVLYAPDVRSLLRTPHQLELQTVTVNGPLDAELTGLLASLPHLTQLSVYDANTITFLSSLPNLHTLHLLDFALGSSKLLPKPEQMIEGLGQCSQLTDLTIWSSKLTAAHVSTLLSRLPAVRQLRLFELSRLQSLSFLSSQPLASTLTGLQLRDCRHSNLSAGELFNVYSLQQLTRLELRDCFSERLDSLTLREFRLPSARLPKLLSSVIECAPPAP